MAKGIEGVLDRLIEQHQGKAPVQLVFQPGLQQAAGLLRRGATAGTYELCYGAQPGRTPMEQHRDADVIMVYDIFEASSVQRVIVSPEVDLGAAAASKSGIIVPGGRQ